MSSLLRPGSPLVLIAMILCQAARAGLQPLSLEARELKGPASDAYHKRVAELVKEWRGYASGTYVPLTERQFLFLHGGDARMANGVFLGDIEAWTINDDIPVTPGDPTVDRIIRYRGTPDGLLLRMGHVAHRGNWGGSYVLISAAKTGSGRVDLQVLDLGTASEGEFTDECKEGRRPGETVTTEAALSVDAGNTGAPPRISVNSAVLDCGTGKSRRVVRAYVSSSSGFVPESPASSRKFAEDLVEASKKARDLHRKNLTYRAFDLLEGHGVRRILFEKPPEMTEAEYLEVINNYAFFIEGYRPPLALEILDSVVARAPRRAVAWLNRAETYLQMVAQQHPSPAEFVRYWEEISKSYETYLGLGGKRQAFFDEFASANPARHPDRMDICGFLDRSTRGNARQNGLPLRYYLTLRTRRMDVNGDGLVERLKFAPGKYGQSYNLVALVTDKGEQLVRRAQRAPSRANDYGVDPIAFGGKVYFLYTDYATEIRGATEHVVCEGVTEPVIVNAADETVCRAVLDGRTTAIQFRTRESASWQVDAWSMDTVRRSGIADIDIDNDGKSDKIAPLRATDGRRYELASLGLSPPSLPADATNRLLGKLQQGAGSGSTCRAEPFSKGCGGFSYWKFEPFRYADRTYIEQYHEDEYGKTDRKVVELAGGRINPLCDLARRFREWRAVTRPER
jgi:hypothetical protein